MRRRESYSILDSDSEGHRTMTADNGQLKNNTFELLAHSNFRGHLNQDRVSGYIATRGIVTWVT
jgi:hypothetical protein